MNLRIAVLTLLFCSFLFAQDFSSLKQMTNISQSKTAAKSTTIDLKSLAESQKQLEKDQLQKFNEYLPIEGSINEKEYILGPGDAILVSYSIPLEYEQLDETLIISPDGNINIQGYGLFNIAGKSLADAKEQIKYSV